MTASQDAMKKRKAIQLLVIQEKHSKKRHKPMSFPYDKFQVSFQADVRFKLCRATI
jgi:hypothetical protein